MSAVSLNLAKEGAAAKVAHGIRRAPRLRQADVYLFQEVRHEHGKPSVADHVAREFGYTAAFGAAPGASDQGLAIVSRYPIADVRIRPLKFCDLRFRSRNRFAIAATVRTPWGELGVWNVHLDTRINARERVEQLQPILEEAAQHPGPRLIGGDFNTNNLYWFRNVLPLPVGPAHCSRIRHSMKQRGFETPFQKRVTTYPLFRSHLDWIFLSELQPLEAGVEPAPFSDHHAVWVGVGL